MEYHELSKKSFEPVKDIIEIVPFEAITPHHPDFEEHESRYNWQHLLSMDSKRKTKDFDKPHSPTERAGMCSHWELIRQRSLTDEPFFVTEHDTYLLPEHEDTFRESLELWEDYSLHYANIGLYMGCYSLSRTFAEQATLMLNNQFPINGGPYGCMERLFKTFLTGSHVTKPFEVTEDFRNEEKTFLHPVEDGKGGIGLRLGKSQREMYRCYNAPYIKPVDISFQIERPTTQMMKKSLGSKSVTQHHQAYNEECIEKPWTRLGNFHFID